MFGALRETSPRTVGPYEVLARLGAGGMGEVHLGTPAGTARGGPEDLVAIKTIRSDVAGDEGFRRRFRRELEVARSVGGRQLARVTGGDADGAVPWMATEYVTGPTLAQAVRSHGPLPEQTVLALGADLVRALRTIHAAQVLHRDLKPGNVLLGADGPKVIDFGIARVQGATTLTATGLMVGTPGFMSPEHLAGGRKVVAASDVFCLASLLCFAATGADPFGDGPVAAVLYRIATSDADLSAVPDGLRPILADCLRPDPSQRPDTEALLQRLGENRSAGWPAPVREDIRRSRLAAEQLCASGVPLLPVPAAPAAAPTPTEVSAPPPPGAGLHALPTVSAQPPAPPGRAAPRRRRTGLVAAGAAGLALAVGAGLVVWTQYPAPGHGVRAAGPPAQAPVEAGVDSSGTADTSGVVPVSDSRPQGWRTWKDRLAAAPLDCSANAKALVCRLVDGSLQAVSAANGTPLWRANLVLGDQGTASYGPTGAFLIPGGGTPPTVRGDAVVFGSQDRVQARNAATGAVLWEQRLPGVDGFVGKAVVADGRAFVTSSVQNAVQLTAYELNGGRRLWSKSLGTIQLSRADRGQGQFAAVSYAKGVLYARGEQELLALDPATGNVKATGPDYGEKCYDAMVHGGQVVCTDDTTTPGGGTSTVSRTRLHVLDAGTLAPQGDAAVPRATVDSSLSVNAIGDHAVVALDRGASRLLVLDRRSAAVLRDVPLPAPHRSVLGMRSLVSLPLLVGDTALLADNTSLYLVPTSRDGAAVRRIPVPGAPGDREEGDLHMVQGVSVSDVIRWPIVLPVGGVVHIVYDEGTVVSVPMPH